MAKVSTKKRTEREAMIDESILGMFAPPGQQQTEEPEAEEPEVDVKSLQERLAALETETKTMRQTNMALMQQAPRVQEQPKVEEISLDGLPDPLDNPKGYLAELNKRIVGSVESRVKAGIAQATAGAGDNRAQELFNDFASRDEYSAIAEDEEKLGIAATMVVNRMAARGVDTEKYMYQGRDMFFKDVAAEYTRVFGKAKLDEDVEDETPDSARAAAVFGGQAVTRKSKQSQEDKGSDMLADLAEIQLKDGFF